MSRSYDDRVNLLTPDGGFDGGHGRLTQPDGWRREQYTEGSRVHYRDIPVLQPWEGTVEVQDASWALPYVGRTITIRAGAGEAECVVAGVRTDRRDIPSTMDDAMGRRRMSLIDIIGDGPAPF